MEECLVCGEQKKFSALQCKMCGMGVENKTYKLLGFVFCSQKCMETFKMAMKSSSASEQEDMIRKSVVI